MSRKSKKSKKKWIIAIAVLLIVVLVCVFLRTELKKEIYQLKYVDYIKKYSDEYELDPYLVAAVIYTESSFDEKAESSKGAIGLMQIMPDTGKWIAKKLKIDEYSLYDAETSIRMGCWYLNYLSERFNGNTDNILAGYNAGPNKVASWLKDSRYSENGITLSNIPYQETEDYVYKVNKYYEIYKELYNI